MTRETHPVWTVYDKLRTSRLNTKYYGRRLAQFETYNFCLELVLAVTAPTSAIAGLWFWNTDAGKIAWQYLGVIAALAAVVKPLLGLTKRIKAYESVLSGYRMLEYDLREIKDLVEQKQKYDGPLQAEFKKALQREKQLVGKNPESHENRQVLRECELEVRSELPGQSFFVPEE